MHACILSDERPPHCSLISSHLNSLSVHQSSTSISLSLFIYTPPLRPLSSLTSLILLQRQPSQPPRSIQNTNPSSKLTKLQPSGTTIIKPNQTDTHQPPQPPITSQTTFQHQTSKWHFSSAPSSACSPKSSAA